MYIVADCGPLANPSNGMVLLTSTVFDSVATYNCSVGFELSNEDSRTCGADEEWTEEAPLCKGIGNYMLRERGVGREGGREAFSHI